MAILKYHRNLLSLMAVLGISLVAAGVAGLAGRVNSDNQELQSRLEVVTTERDSAVRSANNWQEYAGILANKLDDFRPTVRTVNVPEHFRETIVREAPVEVEKLVYINNQWREWESYGQLADWVKSNLTLLWVVGDKEPDCDDYAVRLQQAAYRDGFYISTQMISEGMLAGKQVSNFRELHLGNLAIVGNEYYFIEPQPDSFRIVYVANVD